MVLCFFQLLSISWFESANFARVINWFEKDFIKADPPNVIFEAHRKTGTAISKKAAKRLQTQGVVDMAHPFATSMLSMNQNKDIPPEWNSLKKPRTNFESLVASRRPLLILKRARSGSSWLANTFGLKSEVTNRYVPLDRFGNKTKLETCHAAIERVVEGLNKGGVTMIPDRDGFASTIEGTTTSCWNILVARVNDEDVQPTVVVWTRENNVAQAISKLFSLRIKEKNFCRDPWHLEDCDESKAFKIDIDPGQLVQYNDKMREQNERLKTFAMSFGNPYYTASYEEFLDFSSGGHPKLTASPWGVPIRNCAASKCEEWSVKMPSGSRRVAYAKQKVSNFDEVADYIESKHVDLLPLLLAP